MQTTRLGLVKPTQGINVVEGENTAGVPNEAANLDAIDGKELSIVCKTAFAHTVTFTTALNGGANHKATFGDRIGDQLNIKALGGKCYFTPSINQTLSAS